MKHPTPAIGERALLVQAVIGYQSKTEAGDSLVELERLADTAGAIVLGSLTQRRERPDAAFFIGEGKLAEIQLACREAKANLVIFDNDLSPIQVNNLDLAIGVKVIDRQELILQIFARRARTAEAQIQVELAQLQYLASRIPVSAKQQRFQGGIGMRGPGESPFQLRKAPMLARITILKQKLREIQKRRQRTRTHRPWPMVCLVGYTNAGKSTLLNALTDAQAYVDDRLFATLDTKSRIVFLPDRRQVMLTDTVGFIRHLPHGLVASFRSTLDEIRDAKLLLIVAEASHPCVREHLKVVDATLAEIGAGTVSRLLLLNKADREETKMAMADLVRDYPEAMPISALQREGLAALKERMARMIPAAGLSS
ncbi:MAG: GTPase HflX [Verrucomicrobia bacterium]|nr:GTPase HflX [Verrucomicrobiota bacterium]MCG2679062.1 GTPase HflX [Kiritimatiellia bacterium]MBU4247589.1 GTPase HflX [Verrucomicrobiota bacterium]MBU4291203.1 GTPase HflX [Verrucomicrobiota bacterium]MBU4428455.1 GTPase HflX [Verrucomicrobiota bacterium]